MTLICYAFLANEYGQRGRPADEHRFQVKYGSDFTRYHQLHISDDPSVVTLMFGVHLEAGLFIAVDPAMHRITWFSRSVEFKAHDLAEARRNGWHGWERDRSAVRRKQQMPLVNLQTESLIAFTPENFLRYVSFQRVTGGMDTGERLLLADRLFRQRARRTRGTPHPLETELGLSAHQILDLVGGAFRLKAAVRGSVAEHYLEQHLRKARGVSRVTRIDEDGRPDFEVVYRRRRPVLIECKNTLRRPTAAGAARVDFQKTRASKKDPCSRYYSPDQFEILAACLHPVTERWDFRFCLTAALAPHPTCKGRLSSRVEVAGDIWTPSVVELLEAVARR